MLAICISTATRNINFIKIHSFALSYHLLEILQGHQFCVHVHRVSHVMAQVVRCQLLITQAQVQAKTCPCGIRGGKSGIGIVPLTLNTSVVPCQYHPTNASYSFIHLPSPLCYVQN
jgi:hypothetical protein